MINNIINLFRRKPKPKTGFNYEADKEFTQYLDMCKKDILENIPESKGGIYVGSCVDSDGVIVIGYGKTEIIRKGFKAILEHPTLKEILLQELEANLQYLK